VFGAVEAAELGALIAPGLLALSCDVCAAAGAINAITPMHDIKTDLCIENPRSIEAARVRWFSPNRGGLKNELVPKLDGLGLLKRSQSPRMPVIGSR